MPEETTLKTPLHDTHCGWGARMVNFAGYQMPVHYRSGIVAEHRHCRNSAALFDVSHMGQLKLLGSDAAAALETLAPMDLVDLPLYKQRYVLLTNDQGGLLDDLMVTRLPDGLFVVVNAARKEHDLAHLSRHVGKRCKIVSMPGHALLALQGPRAAQVLGRLDRRTESLTFMTGCEARLADVPVFVTRSGYTGEDGFEISVAADDAAALAQALMACPDVLPAGLGARDTLRLEAGLCLYGHDIDEHTTPVEAGLSWSLQKVRRAGGARAGGYPGAAVIEKQLANGPAKKRVGLVAEGRVPVREGTQLTTLQGEAIGQVTSGTLGPTVNQSIAMAYVDAALAVNGTRLNAIVRGNTVPVTVQPMPFSAHRYHRG